MKTPWCTARNHMIGNKYGKDLKNWKLRKHNCNGSCKKNNHKIK